MAQDKDYNNFISNIFGEQNHVEGEPSEDEITEAERFEAATAKISAEQAAALKKMSPEDRAEYMRRQDEKTKKSVALYDKNKPIFVELVFDYKTMVGAGSADAALTKQEDKILKTLNKTSPDSQQAQMLLAKYVFDNVEHGSRLSKSVVAFVERKGGQLGRGGNYFPPEPDFVNA